MEKVNYIILFSLVIGIFSLNSCDFLDKPQPENAVNVDRGIHTLKGYQNSLYGVYDDFQPIAGDVIEAKDLMSDDGVWTGTFNYWIEIYTRDISEINSRVESIWNSAYKGINDANIIINQSVGKVNNAPQSSIDNIKGQALFMRALNYYYLVQLYSKPWGSTPDNSQLGVPLNLESATSSTDFVQHIDRGTVKDVYKQILSDLHSAEDLITNTNPAYATNDAVLALEAKISFLQGRWEDAAKLAGEVIPHFSLGNDVATYFRKEFSSSSIFEVSNTINDGGGLAAVYNLQRRAGLVLSNSYKKAVKEVIPASMKASLNSSGMKAVDTRTTELLFTRESNPKDIDDYISSNKYEDFSNLADNDPILRLSDLILVRAVALAELVGNPDYPNAKQESIDLLNKIRVRAIKVRNNDGTPGNEALIKYKKDDFLSKQELIDTIFLERRVELLFEGHRTTDLQIRRESVRGLTWDSNKLVLPIPLSQTSADPKIKQNEGYK